MSAAADKVDSQWAKAERLAATIVAGMIREAAYRGEQVSASDLAHCYTNDPTGETACYFRRSAGDAVDLLAKFEADPELLDIFRESAAMSERVDVLAVKSALGLEDCREGSRAVGHCGPDNGEWEDYIEVPVSKLAAVAELIEADREYDAARLAGSAIRIGEAAKRRRAALARVGAAP